MEAAKVILLFVLVASAVRLGNEAELIRKAIEAGVRK